MPLSQEVKLTPVEQLQLDILLSEKKKDGETQDQFEARILKQFERQSPNVKQAYLIEACKVVV